MLRLVHVPKTGNWQLATGNWQLATGNWQLETKRCSPRRHRLERVLDVFEDRERRPNAGLEIALSRFWSGLASIAPRAALGRPVHGAWRRKEKRGVHRSGRDRVLRERRELGVGLLHVHQVRIDRHHRRGLGKVRMQAV